MPLFLNAMGLVNALGNDSAEVWCNVVAGRSPGMVQREGYLPDASAWLGEVQGKLPDINRYDMRFHSRTVQLILSALEQIEAQLRDAIARYGRSRVAVVMGSSTSGVHRSEEAVAMLMQQGAMPANYHYTQQEMGTVTDFVASYLGLSGLAYTVSTACSSSAKVFASARNLMEANVCDAVIVGGADSLCKLTVNGFSALESVSDKLCNPFSRHRKGINIGEGAALFLMSRDEADIALLGVGESSDAYHISAPHPDGDGAEQAMLAALADANLAASKIDYVNLHGTATYKNDEMESKAMSRVFPQNTKCSATKPMTGHTLGAAGATEVGLCYLAASDLNSRDQLPAHLWDGAADDNLPILNFVHPQKCVDKINICMSNSFAFGGSNASVIIGRL